MVPWISQDTKSEDAMSDLKAKLEQAGKKAEKQKAEKQARTVKGAHLREQIEALVSTSGLEAVKNTGFLKVIGNGNKSKLLVAIKGGRIDLSGFTLESPAVTQISEDEAKAKHLGKVRGMVNFDATDEQVLAAVSEALTVLNTPDPVAEKATTERRPTTPEVEVRAEA
jgi:hypothetical protein